MSEHSMIRTLAHIPIVLVLLYYRVQTSIDSGVAHNVDALA